MKIQTVLYKNESLSEEISIEAIEYHKDFEIVRKKLYCTFQGCGAKIEYVPKGKHKAYFKTWPRQDHIEECVDYFEREKKRKSEKGSATLDVALTPSHINRVLREIYKEANENEEDKRNRIEKQKNKSKKKNITVDESQLPSSSVNINPTTEGGKNDLKVGQRAPNVRKRHNIQLLSESDIGFTRAVYGIVQSIIIEKDRVIFKISSGNKECNIRFEEAFMATAASNIVNMFKIADEYKSKGNVLNLSGIGEVTKINTNYQLIIRNQNHFTLNNYKISSFASHYVING